MTRAEEIEYGERARQLLEDPVLQKALSDIEAQYIENWRKTPPEDAPGREMLYRAITCLDHVRIHLNVMAQSGRLTLAHMERLKGRKE
jgi:hypothetical protein